MRSRGFTLIEMAIALAVLSLVLTGLVRIVGAVVGSDRIRTTRAHLTESQLLLSVYVMQSARLPCPADGALVASDAMYGMEQRDPATGDCLNSQARGVLPWRTMAISEDLGTDGLDNRLTYRTAPGVTRDNALNLTQCDPTGSASAVGTAPYQTCATCVYPACTTPMAAVQSRGFTMKDTAGAAHANPANGSGAAYVLIAHGSNGGAYGRSGALQGGTGTIGAAESANFANLPVAASYVDAMAITAPQYFDDEVRSESVLSVAMAAKLGPRTH